MECEMNISCQEVQKSPVSFKSSKVAELLQLCVQPKSEHEMQSVLLNFWYKFNECISENDHFTELDVACIYALNYVNELNDVSSSALSNSLCAYLELIKLHTSEANVMSAVRSFTNLDYLKRESLMDAVFRCFKSANFGFLKFLIKFGFLEFPIEATKRNCKIVEETLSWFSLLYGSDDLKMTLNDFLDKVKQNNIGFRRYLLVFCFICIVLEYILVEKAEMENNSVSDKMFLNNVKLLCIDKFLCLTAFIEAIDETFLTFRDIVHFQTVFLHFFANEAVNMSVQEISRKIFSEARKYCPQLLKNNFENYSPRSLKDLTRCKIRECLQSSKVLPNQVYQLPLPVILKEYLLFENKEIWKNLKFHQEVLWVERDISDHCEE